MKILRSIKCEYLEWEFKCPKNWSELSTTNDDDIKYCESCHSNVYFSSDDEKILQWASEGKCTAFEYADPKQPGVMVGSLMVGGPTENEKKGMAASKIKQINARIKQYGETPELLARLANLYDYLGDGQRANKVRSKINA